VSAQLDEMQVSMIKSQVHAARLGRRKKRLIHGTITYGLAGRRWTELAGRMANSIANGASMRRLRSE
jgi:hypothetical protein